MQTSKIQGQKLRPILFTTDMVRAILNGRKTQTRRIKYKCDVGDVLWVRETWQVVNEGTLNEGYIFKATHKPSTIEINGMKIVKETWRPNIFMPREACRLYLQVEAVREEPLNEISIDNIQKEGIELCRGNYGAHTMLVKTRQNFQKLWDDINAKRGYGWDSNPIVKVIEFRRVEA